MVKHDVYKACLKNFAKVGPCVREKFKLVFEKLSGGSQGYYILKQKGSSFILSRQNFPIIFSSKALLSEKSLC